MCCFAVICVFNQKSPLYICRISTKAEYEQIRNSIWLLRLKKFSDGSRKQQKNQSEIDIFSIKLLLSKL